MSTIVKEFEGRNEKEAIDRAIEELGLDRSEIDFEIVESKRPGLLFRGGKVKIRVHVSEEEVEAAVQDGRLSSERPIETQAPPRRQSGGPADQRRRRGGGNAERPAAARQAPVRQAPIRQPDGMGEIPEEELDQDAAEAALEAAVLRGEPIARAPRPAAQGEALPHEAEIVDFVKTLLGHMGFKAQVVVGSREPNRLGIDVETDKSAVLIGKQGKTLEAFQFICNLAASRLGAEGTRVIIDTQDYRKPARAQPRAHGRTGGRAGAAQPGVRAAGAPEPVRAPDRAHRDRPPRRRRDRERRRRPVQAHPRQPEGRRRQRQRGGGRREGGNGSSGGAARRLRGVARDRRRPGRRARPGPQRRAD